MGCRWFTASGGGLVRPWHLAAAPVLWQTGRCPGAPIRFATRSGELLARREGVDLARFPRISLAPLRLDPAYGGGSRLPAAARWRLGPDSCQGAGQREAVPRAHPGFSRPARVARPGIMVTAPSATRTMTSSPATSPLGRGGGGSGDRLQPLRPGALLGRAARQDAAQGAPDLGQRRESSGSSCKGRGADGGPGADPVAGRGLLPPAI